MSFPKPDPGVALWEAEKGPCCTCRVSCELSAQPAGLASPDKALSPQGKSQGTAEAWRKQHFSPLSQEPRQSGERCECGFNELQTWHNDSM